MGSGVSCDDNQESEFTWMIGQTTTVKYFIIQQIKNYIRAVAEIVVIFSEY